MATYPNRKTAGFTLIEVLIALAILSIALTTIIKVTSINIKNTIYLQNKTIASWVATDVINQVRADVLKLEPAPDTLEDETNILGQTWKWSARYVTTPNPHIVKIRVDVYEKASELKFITLESFTYVNTKQE